jgi:kynureninase
MADARSASSEGGMPWIHPPAEPPTEWAQRIVWDAAAAGDFAEGGKALTREFAVGLDASDPLAPMREEFHFPKTGAGAKYREAGQPSVYLCGNSLGLQPKCTMDHIGREMARWAEHGVEGHFMTSEPWFKLDETPQLGMAKLVGAKPVEVVAMNSLSANLHMMLVTFYQPTAERFKIIIEGKAFPSDWQVVTSQIELRGFDPATALVELTPREGESTLRTEDILDAIKHEGDSVAVVMLSGIQYYTGQLFDIKAITAAGHAAGCKVGWDLAHAVGNVPLYLHDWDVDFACWCTYKYLNSGPGNTAGCFVHEKYADDPLHRLAGWWGHRKSDRFVMASNFIPQRGALGFQLSHAPVVCYAALNASLSLFDRTSMHDLRRRSFALTAFLEQLLKHFLPEVKIMTPSDPHQRGSQLSLEFPDGTPLKLVYNFLQREAVIVDVREPRAMRVAPTPMYNSFSDCWDFVSVLGKALDEAKALVDAGLATATSGTSSKVEEDTA